jgi:glycosyltransferase involved in cell wall biosynthesis
VRLAMRQKIEPRSLLASFRFFDAHDQRITAPDWIPLSPQVGSYNYLAPVTASGSAPDIKPDEKSALASVVVPLRARRMQLRIIRWKNNTGCTLTGLRVQCLGDAAQLAASGGTDLREGSWYVLRGRIAAAAGRGQKLGSLSFTFHTHNGTPILKTAENLTRSGRALNQAGLTLPAQNRRRADGDIDVAVGFRPPGGSTHVSWRLWPGEHGWQLREVTPFALDIFSPDPLVCLADLQKPDRHVTVPSAQAVEIRTHLPPAPVWNSLGLGRLRLLGEWIVPHAADSWLRLGATIADPRRDRETRVFLAPFYFDAEMQPLSGKVPLGCGNDPDIGPYRRPVLQADAGDAGDGLNFREDFRAPEAAAFLACYLLTGGEMDDLRGLDLDAATISADAVGAHSDISRMNQTQLLSAAPIEDATWNPVRRRDVNISLAALNPGTAKFRHRAHALSEQIAELDPAWLPHLPPRPGYKPDPATILHLLKVIYPDESSGGAVRSTSILEAQAALGLTPVACLPLASPAQDREDPEAPVPGGILTRQRGGVHISTLHFPGLQAARIAAADVLEFETGLHARVAAQHRCGLVHAASGFRGYENALKALAIARCYDLPFVYEVRSFHEHTWRPVTHTDYGDALTRMRSAQEDRCMAAADVVVTISEAMVDNLAARGVARDKLFFVPNAISGEFTDQSPPDRIAALRQRLGITGKTVIGYISNFSGREGHAMLLAAFVALIRDGHDLVLVLPGDGPEHSEIARQVHRLGLRDRVILPGNVDHAEIRDWYGVLDLFVVPRIADFASDYVTPLKPYEAMSQGVPVLMSDRPVAREIAGADGARADLFATGDSAALAALIRTRLEDPGPLAARAEVARQWVLRERVWSRVAGRFETIYDAARATHAARRKKGQN